MTHLLESKCPFKKKKKVRDEARLDGQNNLFCSCINDEITNNKDICVQLFKGVEKY